MAGKGPNERSDLQTENYAMTTLTLAKLTEIEAAAAKATPVAWQLVTHRGLAETWMRMTPPTVDCSEDWRPLYDFCDPATVAALVRIARAAVAADKASSIITKQINITRLHDALRAAGLLE